MKKQFEKDIWIDEVLDSTKGIVRPAAPDMHSRIMERIAKSSGARRIGRRRLLPRIAAAAAVLLLVNALSIIHHTRKQRQVSEISLYEVVNQELGSLAEGNF